MRDSAHVGYISYFAMSAPSELLELFNSWDPVLRDTIIKEIESDPIYQRNYYWSIQQYRRIVVERLKKLVGMKLFSIYDYQNNPLKFLTFLRVIGFVDYSTSIKAGVHFTLCGGSIIALGTKKQHKYVKEIHFES
jgi:acyl-CoA oxidase